MILFALIKSYFCYGADRTYRLAGGFVESALQDYGPAIKEIHIVAHFRGGEADNDYLWGKPYSPSLDKLPTVRFFRKKGLIDLQYETRAADISYLGSRFDSAPRVLSAEMFSKVVREVAEKLHLIDPRLKKSDAFDIARFHEDVARCTSNVPQSDAELYALEAKLNEEERRRDALDPWGRLGIDWDDYHPAARGLLNDPFFWEEANDYAPHGNDTGADALMSFRKWNKRHPHQPAHQMIPRLLRDWEIPAVDYNATDQASVRSLFERDADAITITDEALIAVAFAAIKLRGCCDSETRDSALRAIERERLATTAGLQTWKAPSERLAKLDVLATALRNIPTEPVRDESVGK